MSEATSLCKTQQRIMKKFLTLHLGHQFIESDHKREKFSMDYVPYEKHTFKNDNGREVIVWYQSLKKLIEFYVRKKELDLENTKHLAIALGSDYGKTKIIISLL